MKNLLVKKSFSQKLLVTGLISLFSATGLHAEEQHAEQHKNSHHANNAEQHHAEAISYDSLDIAYAKTTEDESLDGPLARGMFSLSESFFAFAEGADLDDSHADIRFVRAGIGFRAPISERVDFISEVGYEELKEAEGSHSVKLDGYGLAAGFRAILTPKIEATLIARYVDFSEEDDVIVALDAVYLINHHSGIVLGYEHGEDDIASIGYRWNFN